jgi:hypothetical protein
MPQCHQRPSWASLHLSFNENSTELPRSFYGLKQTSALFSTSAERQARPGIQKKTQGGNRKIRPVAEELAGSGLCRSVSRSHRIRIRAFRRTSRASDVRTKHGVRNARRTGRLFRASHGSTQAVTTKRYRRWIQILNAAQRDTGCADVSARTVWS